MIRVGIWAAAFGLVVLGIGVLVAAFAMERDPRLKNLTAALAFLLVGSAAALVAGLEDV